MIDRMKDLRIYLFALTIMILFLSACGTNTTNEQEPSNNNNNNENNEVEEEPEETNTDKYGGVLDFAFNAQPPTLDPTGTTATATRDIIRNIFEQLVTFDNDLEVQPMLAESYEINEEANTVTFELREGVTFHNGQEMKADDVVASMEKWAEESSQAKSFLDGVTFTADGDYTVVANLESIGGIDMFIFADLTQIAAIMPKEVVEAGKEDGITEFIGTGPYQFVEWKQDQYIHLERYEDYQGLSNETDGLTGSKEAYVDEMYFHIVTDASTRVAGVQSGEYDIANFLPQDSAEQLKVDEQVELSPEVNSYPGLVFNNKEGILSDKTMRQAIAAALNLEEMMLAAYGSDEFFTMNHELMLEEQTAWYTDAGKDQYDQRDLEKAKSLLEEAGYDGEEIRVLTSREYEDYYTFAVVIQEQLKELDVNVKVDVSDWSTVLEKREDPEAYDIFFSGWGIRPTPIQYPFLASEAEWPGWTNSEEIDRLIDEIQITTDQEKAKELVADLQEEVWDYLPILKPGNKKDLLAYRTNVEGYYSLVGPVLWNISLTE